MEKTKTLGSQSQGIKPRNMASNSKNNSKKAPTQPVKKELPIKAILGVLGIIVLGFGGFYAANHFKPKAIPSWETLDETLSTGQILKHKQAVSYQIRDSDDPSGNKEGDHMFLSLKKIDDLESVWLISETTDFYCVTNKERKCMIEIVFDGISKQFPYDGGDNKTAFITKENIPDFVNKLKLTSEIKVKGYFSPPDISSDKKVENLSATTTPGKSNLKIQKEYSIKVDGLQWP